MIKVNDTTYLDNIIYIAQIKQGFIKCDRTKYIFTKFYYSSTRMVESMLSKSDHIIIK